MKKTIFILLLSVVAFCSNGQVLYINKYLRDSLVSGTWGIYHNTNHVNNWVEVGSGGGITLAGQNYLSLAGSVLTANPVNLSGGNVTGTLAAARFPALTGVIQNTTGSLATSFVAGSILNADVNSNAAITQSKIDKLPDSLLSKNFNLKWFNVVAYGADTTFTIDATAAIQAAINACYAAGGGVVYFPKGHYKIAGALQTSVNGTNPNCQIYIPLTADEYVQSAPSVKLLGEVAPNYNVSGLTPWQNPNTGVILFSTIIGSGTTPSVIGSPYNSVGAGFGDWNFTQFEIENITIRTRSKTSSGDDTIPTVGGINAGHIEIFSAKNIRIETESMLWNSVEPTADIYGIICPIINNNAWTILEAVHVQHMKYGISASENTHIIDAKVWCSVYALALQSSYHAVKVGRIFTAWCKYNVALFGPSPHMPFTIDQLAIEDYNNSNGTKWYANVADMYVQSGVSATKATIKFARVVSNIGLDDDGWVTAGAIPANVRGYDLGGNLIFGTSTCNCSATPVDEFLTRLNAVGGSVTSGQRSALNAFYDGLIANSLYDKIYEMYLFIGGTSATNALAFKDAAHNLVFNGTWSHSSTGSDPDGAVGTYASTGIAFNMLPGLNDIHVSYYSRQDVQNDAFGSEISSGNYLSTSFLSLRIRTSVSGNACFSAGADDNCYSYTNGQGYYIGSKTASNSRITYRNGTAVNTNTSSDGGTSNGNLITLGGTSESGGSGSKAELCFASLGGGLTSGEVATLNTLVEALQDALSRGVQ